MLEKTIEFAKYRHRAVNQKYNNELYEYHLEMVYNVGKKFIHLIPKEHQTNVLCGCWVHDIIEDARETYNDVKMATNEEIAELAYALTNEKGKNRKERGNAKYYEGIRNTPYAAFIKFCDRIANYEYSVKTGSKMQKMYQKENANFVEQIYHEDIDEIAKYLIKIVEENEK